MTPKETEEELTNRLKGKDFGQLGWNKAKYHVSLISGDKYLTADYSAIEEPKHGHIPLPREGYPYYLEYHANPYEEYLNFIKG